MKLFWKLFFPIFFSFFLLVTVISYFTAINQISSARDHILEEHKIIGNFMSKEIEVGYAESTLPFESLKQVSEHEDFLFWWIVKDDGIIHLADDISFVNTRAYDYFPELADIDEDEYASINTAKNHGIVLNSFDVGTSKWSFWIAFSLKEISMLIKNIILSAFYVFISAVSILGLLLYFVIMHSTKPIYDLAAGTNAVASGDLNYHLDIRHGDELGKLAISFNQMTDKLKKSQEAIKKHSKDLEKDVKKRTKQLNEKVAESEKSKAATLNMMEDLTDALEKQKQLEKIKTEFLSVTSHELRTPITPMRGQLEMVLGEFFGKLNEEQKKSLNLVLRNTLILDRLIGDILDISKMESGNMKFIMEKDNLSNVLKDAIETMKFKATEKNVILNLKSGTFPDSILDKDRIRQLIVNLINNAIKFTDTNGKITIDATNKGKNALVKVTDTGIGISKEDQERIFNPFEQVDSSAGRRYEGSGLGLAICHGIVVKHGGKIWVESKPGKGSSFIFTLPYKSMKTEGRMQVELFSQTRKSELSKFKRLANAEGFDLVAGKGEPLLNDDLIRADGRLKPDVSFAQLEVKGYIKKIKKSKK